MANGQNRKLNIISGMDSNIVVEVHTEFAFAAAEFAQLYSLSDATPFQHPLWLQRFYEIVAPHRAAEHLVVTARDRQSGSLCLVLPLLVRQKAGVRLIEATDLGVSDYAAPIFKAGWKPPPGLAETIEAALPAHDLLRIRPIRAEAVDLWRTCFHGETTELGFCAHAADLSSDYSAWRKQALEPGFARYLDRRKKRFLKQPGAGLRLLSDPREIAQAIGTLRERRAGRFDGDVIQHEPMADFYKAVAAEGASVGLARTYALTLEGEDIGHVFGVTDGGRFHYLLIGCDYDRHGRHSPGLLAYDLMIGDWISAGGTVFDFTIGDEPFKRQFGTRPTAMFMLSDAPTWRGKLAWTAHSARERLRGLALRGRLPAAGAREGENDDAT